MIIDCQKEKKRTLQTRGRTIGGLVGGLFKCAKRSLTH